MKYIFITESHFKSLSHGGGFEQSPEQQNHISGSNPLADDSFRH